MLRLVQSLSFTALAVGPACALAPAARPTCFQHLCRFGASRCSARFAMTTIPDVSRYMTAERDAATSTYIMQQTMIRVKDPLASLNFYCDVLGMRLLMYREFPQVKSCFKDANIEMCAQQFACPRLSGSSTCTLWPQLIQQQYLPIRRNSGHFVCEPLAASN